MFLAHSAEIHAMSVQRILNWTGESGGVSPYQYCKKLAAIAPLSLALELVEGKPPEVEVLESPSTLVRFRGLLGRRSVFLECLPDVEMGLVSVEGSSIGSGEGIITRQNKRRVWHE